jgi:TRAP-type C4-dicarboxylate transport system substrate-binding protein
MSPDLFLANHDFWKSLPVDLQKIIEDATRYRVEEILRRNISDIQRAEDYARKKGNTFFNITPEDFVMWQEVAKKTHEKWIADQEAKGLPGKAVYDEARRLIKEYTTTK